MNAIAEILPPGEATVSLVGRPHPLRSDLIEMTVPAGLSIAEMLEIAVPDRMARRHVAVFVGGEIVDREWWPRVRPKPGSRVEFKAWLHGGGGGIFRTLLAIAVLVVAPWAAGAAVGALGLAGTAAGSVLGGLVTAGVGLVGALLVNAIAPPPQPGTTSGGRVGSKVEQLPGIAGGRNTAVPYGGIPVVLGRHLVIPPLAAEPYTEIVGNEEYLRQLFVVGYGPLEITDIKIGDTPIGDFDDVNVEVRGGYDSDTPIKLFPGLVSQEALSLPMEDAADAWQSRTTVADVDEIIVEATAPSGVAWIDKETGHPRWLEVLLEWQYRLAGTSHAWAAGKVLRMSSRKTKTIRRGERAQVARGQYDVRMRRLSEATIGTASGTAAFGEKWPKIVRNFRDEREDFEEARDESRLFDVVFWTSLRGIQEESPIHFDKRLAIIAVRIRATEQLNGVIDDLSCIATSHCRDWNGTDWVVRGTRNPASLYRHLFQGPHLSRPLASGRMDLDELQAWHNQCSAKAWHCDAVLSDQRTLLEVARDVASTGRAAFAMRDGKYSVRRDVAQSVPVQMFTPRNIIAMSAERVFSELPHALRVQFVSEDAGYQADEVLAYDDGRNAGNSTIFDRLDLWGVTDSLQARRHGRYYFAAAKLRPERLTITADIEHVVCRPGDMVRVAHDFILVGIAQGRIVSLTETDGDVTSVTLDEDCLMETGLQYGASIRPAAGDGAVIFRAVALDAGLQRTLSFTSVIPESAGVAVGDLVAFGLRDRVTTDWTVREIMPAEDYTGTLTLVPHAPQIHAADTSEIPEYNPRITIPVEMRRPARPRVMDIQTGTDALERLPNGGLRPRILLTVKIQDGPSEPPIAFLEAQVKDARSDAWEDDGITVRGLSLVEVRDVLEGTEYDICVRAVSTTGQRSPWITAPSIMVIGKREPPDDVEDFHIAIVGWNGVLSWTPVNDIDLAFYEIRHSIRLSGATWTTARIFRDKVTGSSVDVPLLVGTYLIKAVDSTGNRSINAASVTTTVARLEGLNFIEEFSSHPDFAGTKDSLVVDEGVDGLRLDFEPGELIPVEMQDGVDLEIQDGVAVLLQEIDAVYYKTGSYYPADTIDVGAVYTSRVSAKLLVGALDLLQDFLAYQDILALPDIFGNNPPDGLGVLTYIRTSDGAEDLLDEDGLPLLDEDGLPQTTPEPAWSGWRQFIVGDYTARAFQFRIDCFTRIPGVTPVVEEATFTVDMPDRIVRFEATVAAGGSTIAFDPPFFVPPKVGISVQDGASGDRYTQSITEAGVTLHFFNSGGTGVARQVTGLAQAYGSRET